MVDVAFLINNDGGFSDTVCYFCHQTAEKTLKALLLSHKIMDFPHIHKLSALWQQVKKIYPDANDLKEPISVLDKYYIEAKYPMDFPIEYSKIEAKTAIDLATKIYNFAEKIITEARI